MTVREFVDDMRHVCEHHEKSIEFAVLELDDGRKLTVWQGRTTFTYPDGRTEPCRYDDSF